MVTLCVNHVARLLNAAKVHQLTDKAPLKVGIYPGAFDPVHEGHVAFAQLVIAQHGLDKVFFLPEPTPRYRQAVKAYEHRLAMIKLAIKKYDSLGVIQLDHNRFTV